MEKYSIIIPLLSQKIFNYNLILKQDTNVFDNEIFPVEQYIKYLDVATDLSFKLKESFYIINNFISMKRHYYYIKPESFGKIYGIKTKNILTKFYKKIDNIKLNKLLKYKTDIILKYHFQHYVSIEIYKILNQLKLINIKDTIFIVSKNNYILDGIIYYMKYVLQQFKSKNITFYLYLNNNGKVSNHRYETIKNYLEEHKINPFLINTQFDNSTISDMDKNLENKYNTFIIDINIYINTLILGRSSYGFQSILSLILLSLKKIHIGGNLIIYCMNIHQKAIMDFYLYLGTLFNNSKIQLEDTDYYGDPFMFLIYTHFNGIDDIIHLENLQQELFNNDNSGGYKFSFNKKEYDYFYKYTNHPYNKYKNIDSIFKLEHSNKIKKFYKQYRDLLIIKYDENIRLLNNIYSFYINKNNTNYVTNILETNIITATKYAQLHNLPLKKWAIDKYKLNETYYKQYFINLYSQIQTINININNNNKYIYIIGNYQDLINKYIIFDNVMAFNMEKYNNINNIIKYENNINKNVVKKSIKYNSKININNKWIELLELYRIIDVLKITNNNNINIHYVNDNINNFSEFTKYYIDNNITNTIYNHNINNNISKKYNKKNKNIIDILISDIDNDVSIIEHNNILLKSLLLPKNSGNFLLRTNINNNPQYISLLYISKIIYKNVYIFKPGKFELDNSYYIIGIDKIPLTISEENNLEYILTKLEQKIILYPVDVIDNAFLTEYGNITQNILNSNIIINDVYEFISQNTNNKKSEKYIKLLINNYKKTHKR